MPYHRYEIYTAIAQNHHCTRLSVSVSRQRDHHAVFHFRLAAQCRFEVLGINIHAGWRDDHIFLPSLEIQVPGRIEVADIAGPVPSLFPAIGFSS